MVIRQDVSLRNYNTFGIEVKASNMALVDQESDLSAILQNEAVDYRSILVLGGGSNILFSGDYQGMVLKNNILGRELLKEDSEYVWIRLGAGENWHRVVLWAIEQGWGGIENLSLIPGTMGAAPMQNIGAYGVEICSVFESLEAVELATGKLHKFTAAACDFGYRYSAFKGPFKGQFMITRVILRLRKQPIVNISYGAVAQTLEQMGVKQPTIRDISKAIIRIREQKLPDPEKIGNAGSFFKNPTIDREFYQTLKTEYTNIPSYPINDNLVKIPAAWLIEQCQWKGFRKGPIGVHKNQALVLVNHGGAQGPDLVQLSQEIQASVTSRFGIDLVPEVNIV